MYENYAVLRVTVKNGKVVNIKEWSNPFKYYAAIHVTLPTFYVKIPEKPLSRPCWKRRSSPCPSILLTRRALRSAPGTTIVPWSRPTTTRC